MAHLRHAEHRGQQLRRHALNSSLAGINGLTISGTGPLNFKYLGAKRHRANPGLYGGITVTGTTGINFGSDDPFGIDGANVLTINAGITIQPGGSYSAAAENYIFGGLAGNNSAAVLSTGGFSGYNNAVWGISSSAGVTNTFAGTYTGPGGGGSLFVGDGTQVFTRANAPSHGSDYPRSVQHRE